MEPTSNPENYWLAPENLQKHGATERDLEVFFRGKQRFLYAWVFEAPVLWDTPVPYKQSPSVRWTVLEATAPSRSVAAQSSSENELERGVEQKCQAIPESGVVACKEMHRPSSQARSGAALRLGPLQHHAQPRGRNAACPGRPGIRLSPGSGGVRLQAEMVLRVHAARQRTHLCAPSAGGKLVATGARDLADASIPSSGLQYPNNAQPPAHAKPGRHSLTGSSAGHVLVCFLPTLRGQVMRGGCP